MPVTMAVALMTNDLLAFSYSRGAQGLNAPIISRVGKVVVGQALCHAGKRQSNSYYDCTSVPPATTGVGTPGTRTGLVVALTTILAISDLREIRPF